MAKTRTRIIAEIGSTFLNRKDLIKDGIERLTDLGVDAVKFQLFPNTPKFTASGNIWLSPDLFYYAVEIARHNSMDISASVFDDDSLDILLKITPTWVKFAYSRSTDLIGIRRAQALQMETIVSCDIMNIDQIPIYATRLFCIPSYPVYYEIRFDEIFPRFAGFSDHSLGYEQTVVAVQSGAKIIEKHVKLIDKGCPDCSFALSIEDFGRMVQAIRRIE